MIVVSEQISRQLIKKYPVIEPKMNIIPNGFDPDDFNNIDEPTSELKSISYIGSLSESYPIQRFISAFKFLCKSSSEWQLKYVGNISESTKDLIKENQLERNTEFIPYAPHNEAIKHMLSSDLLLLIIPKTEQNKGILTGKLFEYIASRRPILFIGPIDGDAALILSEFENAVLLDYTDDIDLHEITRKLSNQRSNSKLINKYSRISQTGRIAQLID